MDLIPSATTDPDLPGLADALDPRKIEAELGPAIRRLVPGDAEVGLIRARVLAYKPRRRCVIAYQFDVRHDGVHSSLRLIGKIRRRKSGESAYTLLRALWGAGFAADSADGISVPEPITVVPAFGMWVQRRIEGSTMTALLMRPEAATLARRVAEATHKLHRAGVPTARRHTVADELAILDRCFADVATAIPETAERLARLAGACHRAAATLPEPAWCGSHRDFYSDQVMVDRDKRLFLIDFDLYCEADPGLDVGNFLGHVTEHALRQSGDAAALGAVERALHTRFRELAGPDAAASARVYAALTLARHVYLSHRIADRRPATNALLTLAQERVSAVIAEGGHA